MFKRGENLMIKIEELTPQPTYGGYCSYDYIEPRFREEIEQRLKNNSYEPVLINSEGHILFRYLTFKIAKELGFRELFCIVIAD